MAATLIQTVVNFLASSTTITATLTPGGPNHSLIAYATSSQLSRTITVADNVNAGNYNQDTLGNGTGCSAGIFSIHNVGTSSTTVTATISSTASGVGIIVEEWSGLLVPTPLDKVIGRGVSAVTSGDSGTTATLSSAPELAVSIAAFATNATGLAISSGPFVLNATTTRLGSANYQPATTSGVIANWSWTTSQGAQLRVATYQLASAPSTILYNRRNVLYFI